MNFKLILSFFLFVPLAASAWPVSASTPKGDDSNSELFELEQRSIELLRREQLLLNQIEAASAAAVADLEKELGSETLARADLSDLEKTAADEQQLAGDHLKELGKELERIKELFARQQVELLELRQAVSVIKSDLEAEKKRLLVLDRKVEDLEQEPQSARKSGDCKMSIGLTAPTKVSYLNQNAIQQARAVAFVSQPEAALYLTPDRASRSLGCIEEGTRLQIESQLSGWFRVTTPDNRRGWIAAVDLHFPASGREVPDQFLRVRAVGSDHEPSLATVDSAK